jgi:hypothetical protein
MNDFTLDGDNEAVLQATSESEAITKANAVQERQRSFIPFPGYVPPSNLTYGTQEHSTFLSSVADSEIGKKLYGDAYAAIEHKASYTRAFDSFKKEMDSVAATPMSSPEFNAERVRRMEELKTRRPFFSPYASFLTSFGNTQNEIVTGLVQTKDKADFYYQKYKEMGLAELIEKNKGLADDPEAMARIMKSQGFFNPNTDEEAFFIKNARDKYAAHFGHSVWARINSDFSAKLLKSGGSLASLPFQMAAGRRLDVNNPSDRQLYMDYWSWSKSQQGTDWLASAGQACVKVVEDCANTLFHTASILRPDGGNLEYQFDGDFVNPIGKNKELRDRFEAQWRELKGWYDQGRLGGKTSLFYEFRKFEGKETGKPIGNKDFDIEDPTVPSTVPKKFEEFVKTFREIREKGGFKHDVPGLTALTSNIDGALQMTVGLAGLTLSTDPNSFVTKTATSLTSGFESAPSEWQQFKDPKTGEMVGIDSLDLTARMRYFNVASAFSATQEHWRESGMIAPSVLYDKELGNEAAGWEDISLLLGPGKLIAQRMFAATGGKAIDLLKVAGEVDKQYMAMAANAERAAAVGVKLPQELTDAITVVRENSKKAGIEITENEAIQKIYSGEPAIIDPKTGTLVPLSAEALHNMTKNVAEAFNATKSVRNELARLALQGRSISYSEKTMKSMENLRTYLIENEKVSGINWAEVPTQDLYERLRLEKLPVPEGIISRESLNELKAEVGLSWKKFDARDIRGWKRAGVAPVEIGFNPSQKLYEGIGTLLSSFGSASGRWQRIAAEYGPNEAATAVTIRQTVKAGADKSVGASNSTIYGAWTIAHSASKFFDFVGQVGEGIKFLAEYRQYAKKEFAGQRFGSSLKAMQADAEAAITRLDRQVAEWSRNPAFKTEKDVAELLAERGKQVEKLRYAGLLHHLTNGSVGEVGVMLKNGVYHAGYNYAIANAVDTRDPFAMVGFTAGITPINRLIHGSMTRTLNPGATIEEKTNNSLVEFSGHLATRFEGNDNQRRNFIEVLMAQAKKAQEVGGKHGVDAGKRYFGYAVEAMNGLFRSGAEVELHESGVIDGLTALMKDSSLNEDPAFAMQVRGEFLMDAAKYGLKGEEAIQYANEKIDALNRFNAGQARKLSIATEIDTLKTQRDKLLEDTHTHLFKLEQASRALMYDLGMSPDHVRTEIKVDANGNIIPDIPVRDPITGEHKIDPKTGQPMYETGVKLLLDGKEIPEDTPVELKTKAIHRINALIQTHDQIKAKQLANEMVVKQINEKLQGLANEQLSLELLSKNKTFRPGDVIYDEKSQTRVTSYKDGICIWEQDDGTGNVKTKIILDKRKFSLETTWEETIHALTYTENMHRARTKLNMAFFGHWEQDQNDPTKIVQAKTDPKTGVSTPTPPGISGDLDMNIDLLRTFATSYADGLEASDKAVFMAKFETGIRRFQMNQLDLAGLEPVMAELIGDIYVRRKALSGPFTARGAAVQSSPTGSWEMGANVGGVSKPRLWAKFLMGGLSLEEIALEGRELNLKELGIGIDPKNITPEQDYFQRKIQAAARFMSLFGVGGEFDQQTAGANRDRALRLGLDPDLWAKQKMYDINGNLVQLPAELHAVGSAMMNDTRERGSPLRTLDVFNEDSVSKNENSTDANHVAERVKWALSTGRRNWVNAAGQFRRPFWELMQVEQEPIRDFFRLVATEQDKNGQIYGLRLQKIKGGYSVAGTPNLEQAKAIQRYFKDQIKGENDTPLSYYNISNFISSIAEGNIFDKEAARPGHLLAFSGEYAPVWTAEGQGKYQGDQYKRGTTRQLNVVPFAMVIMDTSLDHLGDETQKNVRKGFGWEKQTVVGPQIYFWGFDLDAFDQRRQMAMRGTLADAGGNIYFEKGEVLQLFGNFDRFAEATKLVLANYSTMGGMDQTTKEFYRNKPGQRSWQALLPLTEDKKGKTNPILAQKMADAINRIIGFPTNAFKEVTLLEKELITGESGGRKLTKEELAIKEEQFRKLKEKNPTSDDLSEINLAHLGAEVGRNQFGGTPGFKQKESSFMLFRPDRFVGPASPLLDGNGLPVKLQFSNYGALMGGINYSNNQWTTLSDESLKKETSGYDTRGSIFHQAWAHDSGYKVFLMQTRDEKGRLGKKEYRIFDANRNLVKNDIPPATIEDAYKAAQQHAENNNQPPIAGNVYEQGMTGNGWMPKGANIIGVMRDRWISPDGDWTIRRSQKGDTFDLIHNQTGFTVAKKIPVISADKKTQGVDLKDVNAAIADAKENNTIHIMTRDAAHAELEAQGLAEWHYVPSINEKGLLQNKKQLFANDNPEYYDFKRILAYGNGKFGGFGPAYAKTVTDLMKKELGEEVILKDREKTVEWIYKWLEAYNPEQMAKEVVEKMGSEDAEIAKRHAEQAGLELKFGKPTEPKEKDFRRGPNGEEFDAEGWNKAKARYDWEIVQYERHLRERSGINPREIETQGLRSEKDWIGANPNFLSGDESIQLNWQSQFDSLASDIKGLRERVTRAKQSGSAGGLKVEPKPTDVNFDSSHVIKQITNLKNETRAFTESAKSAWITNRAGYLIQSLMYKEPPMPLGIEVSIGRIGLFSNRLNEGRGNYFFQGPSSLPRNQFIVYSPAGIMVGKYDSLEKAQEASFNHHKKDDPNIKALQAELSRFADAQNTTDDPKKVLQRYRSK